MLLLAVEILLGGGFVCCWFFDLAFFTPLFIAFIIGVVIVVVVLGCIGAGVVVDVGRCRRRCSWYRCFVSLLPLFATKLVFSPRPWGEG